MTAPNRVLNPVKERVYACIDTRVLTTAKQTEWGDADQVIVYAFSASLSSNIILQRTARVSLRKFFQINFSSFLFLIKFNTVRLTWQVSRCIIKSCAQTWLSIMPCGTSSSCGRRWLQSLFSTIVKLKSVSRWVGAFANEVAP